MSNIHIKFDGITDAFGNNEETWKEMVSIIVNNIEEYKTLKSENIEIVFKRYCDNSFNKSTFGEFWHGSKRIDVYVNSTLKTPICATDPRKPMPEKKTIKEALSCIVHELTHYVQILKIGVIEMNRINWDYDYFNNPLETEARNNEVKLSDEAYCLVAQMANK